MKKLIYILAIFLSWSLSLDAQYYVNEKPVEKVSLEVRSLATQSIHGQKVGFGINLNLNQRWQFSYFMLKPLQNSETAIAGSSYEGGQIRFNINPKNKLTIGPAVKIGYHDKMFLTVLPSIQATYHVVEKINVTGGVAYSDGFPYFNLELGYKLFGK